MLPYRKSDQLKKILTHQIFVKFTDAIKVGSAGLYQFADDVYKAYTIEDPTYGDDMQYYQVMEYFAKVVVPHKVAVYNAGMEMAMKPWFAQFYINRVEFEDNLLIHDISKFSANESFGYAARDFKSKDYNLAFEMAWHHHKMHNPHHPEYWMNPNRSGKLDVLPMPTIYILEMIADWIGAGEVYGNSLQNWLPDNLHKFLFHERARLTLHDILLEMNIETRAEENFLVVV